MTIVKMEELNEEAVDLIAAASVWKPASVKDEPHTRLTSWKVMLVGEKYVHFVGYTGHEGRVCSAVQTYDNKTKRGITRSGRIYELVGPSGHNSDAQYVWAHWLEINGLTSEDARNISEEY